jgi:hypothetical protein
LGFGKIHATTEQVHRIVKIICDTQESDQYCTAAFLDISQAFDKVRHHGLFYKIKATFLNNIYNILQLYLHNRYFLIRYREAYTTIYSVSSAVPLGSVLGPLLYLIYTADLPVTPHTETATFADDTALHVNPEIARHLLQTVLSNIQEWLKKWSMKANETKFTHVTFILKPFLMSTCATEQYVSNTTRQRKIPRNTSGPRTNLAQTYNHQEKTPGPTVPKIILDSWTKVAIIP